MVKGWRNDPHWVALFEKKRHEMMIRELNKIQNQLRFDKMWAEHDRASRDFEDYVLTK